MSFIKNYTSLCTTSQRKIVLDLIDIALQAIQPSQVLDKHVTLRSDVLTVQQQQYDLRRYKRIFLVGFGKGSSGICKVIETMLGEKLTAGFDIDVVDETFEKIQYTKGTHPLPSQQNLDFTKKVLDNMTGLTENDLVLVVICGGGSVLFEDPHTLSLEQLIQLNTALLRSGATISEMNAVRKHVSKVKGGGLVKSLSPARIVSLIFSDVPGNDLSVIASGPTIKDITTLQDVQQILKKYPLLGQLHLPSSAFLETPKEETLFRHVSNILLLSNVTALSAMKEYADAHGYDARIYTDRLQADAKKIGKQLIDKTKKGEILLVGGETTVKVTGNGKGGRNQALVLASLPDIDKETVIAAFGTDGWDYITFAGAIGDMQTVEKAKVLGLSQQEFLENDDSTTFFEKTGDGINTGKLESNVSDLMIVYRWSS